MKIGVSSTGTTLDSALDPRFGRCKCFIVVDSESLEFEAVANVAGSLGGGAGIRAAQILAERGVKAVLTGNCGPNAFTTLSAANIQVITGCGGTVKEAIAAFESGSLRSAKEPSVESHHGMGDPK
jgi:predicted Fe-Mo cluster-binding NifX family protein